MSNLFGMQNPAGLTYHGNGVTGIGSLPYAYNPSSTASTTCTGNLWADDNICWNLNDPVLVQNLPETQSVMRGLQYNGIFSQQQPAYSQYGGGGNFFDSLIQKQQLMNYALMQNSRSDSSGSSIPMLLQLLAATKAENEAKNAPDETVRSYKNTDLDKFAKNQASDSTIKYGDINDFAANNYTKIKDKEGHVTLKAAFESIGVKTDDLSKEEKLKICKTMNFNDDALNKAEDHYISKETYQGILEQVGFNSKSSSISRQKLQDGINTLIGKTDDTEDSDDVSSSSAIKEEIQGLKTILNKESPTAADADAIRTSIKKIAGNKTALKAFIESIKSDTTIGINGTSNILSSLFATLEEADEDNSMSYYSDIIETLRDAAKNSKDKKLIESWNGAVDKSLTGSERAKMKDDVWWGRKDRLDTITSKAKVE